MTENYLFVGQTGTQVFDGFAGLRLGQAYQLSRTHEGSGHLAILRPTGIPLLISEQELASWFRPATGPDPLPTPYSNSL